MSYDMRPALARKLWRDTTKEHWAYSLAVDVGSAVLFYGSVLGLLYLTRAWWVPIVLSAACS